jgi:DNA (cytosine-5)-methyltransferase 1
MKYISLFSGGMGLDLGLEKAGFECAVCVENDIRLVPDLTYCF